MTETPLISLTPEFNRIVMHLGLDKHSPGYDVSMDFNGIRITYYEDPKGAFRYLGVSSPDTEDQFLAVQNGPRDSENITFSCGTRRELNSLADRICSAPATP
jgi:hypothetical protein